LLLHFAPNVIPCWFLLFMPKHRCFIWHSIFIIDTYFVQTPFVYKWKNWFYIDQAFLFILQLLSPSLWSDKWLILCGFVVLSGSLYVLMCIICFFMLYGKWNNFKSTVIALYFGIWFEKVNRDRPLRLNYIFLFFGPVTSLFIFLIFF